MGFGDNSVNASLATGQGTFAFGPLWPAGWGVRDVATGDFDRDGVMDIATANNYSNTVSVLRGVGDGTFFAPTEFAVGPGPLALATGDFNRDGWLDVVGAYGNESLDQGLLGADQQQALVFAESAEPCRRGYRRDRRSRR